MRWWRRYNGRAGRKKESEIGRNREGEKVKLGTGLEAAELGKHEGQWEI